MEDLNQKILKDFYKTFLTTKERPQVYYKVQDSDLYIVVVIKDEISFMEEKVYEAEWKVLDKYPNFNIRVRVVPKFNYPVYKVVPEGFSKYVD